MQPNKSILLLPIAVTLTILGTTGCSGGVDKATSDRLLKLEEQNKQLQSRNASLEERLSKAESRTSTDANTSPAPSATGTNTTSDGNQINTSTTDNNTATGETSAPAPNTPAYTDLTDVPQKKMILDLAKYGIFDNGDKFRPFETINRGQYCTWLFKATNALLPANKQINLAPGTKPFFTDLKDTDPCYPYVQALANAGYSVGYEDNTFKSQKPITREEMIGIKVGVDCGKAIEPYRSQMQFIWKFADGKQIDERYTGYIQRDFYEHGPLGGNIQRAFGKIGAFKPKQAATRAEAAATLWQAGEFANLGAIADKTMDVFKTP